LSKSTGLLEKLLGHQFADRTLLQQALTHRSAGNRNNERLEFLGDAILGAVIAEELFRRHPKASEGKLSRLRSRLVRRESLRDIARALDIGQYLILGAGERRSGGHRRDSILSDAVEALLGAIYLEGGFGACKVCILSLFEAKLDALPDVVFLKDAKTRLQEYLQSRQLALPEYAVTTRSGEAHAQFFKVACTVRGLDATPTSGEGGSRRQAEQQAAERMLAQLGAGEP
jgi:ribonuclease-3